LELNIITSFTVVIVACRHTLTTPMRDSVSDYYIRPIKYNTFFQIPSDFFRGFGKYAMNNVTGRRKIRHPPPANRLVLRSEATLQSGMRSAYNIRPSSSSVIPLPFSVSLCFNHPLPVFVPIGVHSWLNFRRLATPDTAQGHPSLQFMAIA
jgi:hypothetical protein